MKKFKLLLIGILFSSAAVFAQQKVTGTVIEKATGEGLPGVSVVVKGTTKGTQTDFDGNFEINNVKTGDVLVFSFLGFTDKEVTIGTNLTLRVEMEESSETLDEIVVVGYGTTTKKDATGSVDVISTKDFNKGAVASADQLLQGKVAGVRITNAGGSPDSAPNIRIRGGASLSANNNPLIVIDGVPLDNGGTAGVSNPLNLINPNDIESFSILKDASATAIYGSRASNGVIIITTKRGTSGQAKFNFSSTTSISSIPSGNLIDVMSSGDFVTFIQNNFPDETVKLGVPTGSVVTDEVVTQTITASDGSLRDIYASNWQNAILRTALSLDNNFSARANIKGVMPMRASVGYSELQGVVSNDDYNRLNASLSLAPKFFDDHLSIDVNAKYTYIDKNAIDGDGSLGGSLTIDPTKPIFDSSSIFGGFYNQIGSATSTAPNALTGASNPLALLEQRTRPEKIDRFLGNIKFDYKLHFFPEMRAVLNLGTESSNTTIEEIFSDNSLATYRQTATVGSFIFNPGLNYFEKQEIRNTTLDAYLVYNKSFENKFIKSIELQGGYAYQNFENRGTKREFIYYIQDNDDTTDDADLVGTRVENIDPNNPTNLYFNPLNLQSFFSRANINLNDKYLVTLSFRADGSSLFTKENRWGYFPAAALAWQVKEEDFLKDVSVVNALKVRFGWGNTGQQDVTGLAGFFPATPLFEVGSVTSQYLSGLNLYSAKEFNPDLTWEKTTTYNIGLDFDLFENSIVTGNFDVYRRFTSDLLVVAEAPPGQALSTRVIQNIGETESEGFELGLNLNVIQKDNMNLTFNGNLAYNRTDVTALTGVEVINQGTIPVGTGTFLFKHALNEQAYSAHVFKQVYDVDGNPIPGSFVDLNGDNVINDSDKFYQPIRPNWTFGFGFNFDYENWNLSSSFRGQLDGKIYNSARLVAGFTERAIQRQDEALNNVLNFNSGAANAVFTNIQGNQPLSDYFLEDAAFLRCENIAIGYTFNKLIKNATLRVSGVVNNPFLITNYSGQDPENFNGLDNNFYPRPTVYTFGLNLDF